MKEKQEQQNITMVESTWCVYGCSLYNSSNFSRCLDLFI